ncbi:hypothetical protein FWH09_03235 [Candidatus Saccharibacteria bacterium]|nr:hypothetical protein [Candidatus Saccharibacteria bacterium]
MPKLEKWYFDFANKESKTEREFYEDTDFARTIFKLYSFISLQADWDKEELIKQQGEALIKADFPTKFSIKGKVSGHGNFADGDIIKTSFIKKLLFQNGTWVAVTHSNSAYQLGEMDLLEKRREEVMAKLKEEELKSYFKAMFANNDAEDTEE